MADEPTQTAERHSVPRVVSAIADAPWAITEAAMDQILAIAGRENEVSPEALEAYRARTVAQAEYLTVRGNVGILKVHGPMMRYGDFFTSISGAMTYDGIARDVVKATDDATIKALLIDWDTPGGEVNGCSELAALIRMCAARKPIESYVGGQCCSAGYWLASATSKITISQTAILGSIGVRMGIRDTSERDAKSGVRNIEFISSRAPNKRTDWNSDEGKGRIQKMADQLEAVFVSEVAANRGRTDDEVIAKFGAGGVEVGTDAVSAGMADALGSFEGVLSSLTAGNGRLVNGRKIQMTTGADTPAYTHTQANLDDAARRAKAEGETLGATAAQTRIAAILDSDEAKTRPTQARHLAFKTSMSADEAKGLMAASAEEVKADAKIDTTTTGDNKAPKVDGDRSKDVSGGLALGTLNDKGPDAKEKAPTISASATYGKRNKINGVPGH